MLCTICRINEVKAEGQDVCVTCHYTGNRFAAILSDDERSNVLTRIRDVPHVTSAEVWHNGQNLFQLGIMLDDGRLIAPGAPVEAPGGIGVLGMIPPLETPWAVSIVGAEQESASVLGGLYDDDELVEVVGRIAENKLADEDIPKFEGNTDDGA